MKSSPAFPRGTGSVSLGTRPQGSQGEPVPLVNECYVMCSLKSMSSADLTTYPACPKTGATSAAVPAVVCSKPPVSK